MAILCGFLGLYCLVCIVDYHGAYFLEFITQVCIQMTVKRKYCGARQFTNKTPCDFVLFGQL